MSNEHIERRIEFIIEHQASFSVEMDKMRESLETMRENMREDQEKWRERNVETDRRLDTLSEISLSLFKLMSEQGQYISQVDAQIDRLDHRSARHEEELETVCCWCWSCFCWSRNHKTYALYAS